MVKPISYLKLLNFKLSKERVHFLNLFFVHVLSIRFAHNSYFIYIRYQNVNNDLNVLKAKSYYTVP